MNPSVFKLAVTKPCLQDWDSMQPTEDGKYCFSCKKQVIDFSTMNDAAVQNYFLNNTNQSTCGRFYTSQLERIQIYLPKNILNKPIAIWKKYLVCLLICFGTQLFPVDIFIGSSPNLYAQTVDSAAGKKTNVKRLRISTKRYRMRLMPKTCTINGIMGDVSIVMGYTQTLPADTKSIVEIPKMSDKLDSVIDLTKEKPNKDTTTRIVENNAPNKGPMPKDEPYQKFEFILPDSIRIKKSIDTKA